METNYKRAIDIPVFRTEPIIFTFTQTAIVDLTGQYVWTVNKQRFTPDIRIEPTSLYFFRTISFGADIAEGDYQGGIFTLPVFHIYTEKSGNVPDFRAPVPLPIYFQTLPYERGVYHRGAETNMGNEENRFLGTFEGVLDQTPSLIGKQSVTLTVLIALQEINDQNFILDRGGR